MNAIPTHYNGVNYRSRLEAKWAKFFDIVGWRYDYEPLDLNGYIPDFYLHGKNPCFVEIKPSMTYEALASDNQKSIKILSGSGVRMLYLGATIGFTSEILSYARCDDKVSLGLMIDFYKGQDSNDIVWDAGQCDADYQDDAYFVVCPRCRGLSFTGVEGGWATHCCNEHVEDHDMGSEPVAYWKEAGNTTQYKRIFLAK